MTAVKKMRTCRACGQEKPTSDFYKDKRTKDGTQSKCKPCFCEAQARYIKKQDPAVRSAKNAKYGRAHRLRKSYNISTQDFSDMLMRQGGKCAICGREGTLCVDHDHITGAVRGLLCRGCNTGIGGLGDSVANLMAAVEYLRRSP